MHCIYSGPMPVVPCGFSVTSPEVVLMPSSGQAQGHYLNELPPVLSARLHTLVKRVTGNVSDK